MKDFLNDMKWVLFCVFVPQIIILLVPISIGVVFAIIINILELFGIITHAEAKSFFC